MDLQSEPADGEALPLWLLDEEEFAAWRAAQPAAAQRWLGEQTFDAGRDQVITLPDATGAPWAAVGGIGKASRGLSPWRAAAIADRLPPRRYASAQAWSDEDATQLALGFAYAAYRFERYRRRPAPRVARLDWPPNADRPHVERVSEALALARDWINTPAGDFGPADLAAAARRVALSCTALRDCAMRRGLFMLRRRFLQERNRDAAQAKEETADRDTRQVAAPGRRGA